MKTMTLSIAAGMLAATTIAFNRCSLGHRDIAGSERFGSDFNDRFACALESADAQVQGDDR